MHFTVRIHLGGPGGSRAGSLLAGLLVSLLLSSWPADSRQKETPAAVERKCQPILNFGLPAREHPNEGHQANLVKRNRSSETTSASTSSAGSNHQLSPKLSQSIGDSFSFSIGDIDLPLSPETGVKGGTGAATGGAVQAAMKLFAALDSQIYGDTGEEEEEQEEQEDGDQAEGAGAGATPNEGGGSRRARNVIRFRNNKLHLAGLNFTMLNVHLYEDGEPKFAIGINIQNTTLAGQFQYDGLAPTASLLGSSAGEHAKLAGHYRMSIDNVLVTAASNLTKVPTWTQTTAAADSVGSPSPSLVSKLRLATNGLHLNISNLGYISIDILDAQDASRPTSNYVLKMLQRVLQKTIKRTYSKFEDYIRQTLELEGRQFLDCELTRFSPLLKENLQPVDGAAKLAAPRLQVYTFDNLTASESATAAKQPHKTYLEDLAKIIGAEMASSHLDRIRLPDFEYQRAVFGSQANIQFGNGSLLGLNNIRLNGETRVKLLEEHLIVNASIGWVSLRPHYNWTLYFGASQATAGVLTLTDESSRRAGSAASQANLLDHSQQQEKPSASANAGQVKPVARGFVAFNIKAIDFDAVISKSVRSQSRMVVDELVIRRLESPKMDIGGLPGMNRLTRGVVNFFMGRLKQRLVSSIQPALKQELERALNRLALFN